MTSAPSKPFPRPGLLVPRSADALDASWIEALLAAQLGAVRVASCAVEPLSARSATGQLVRVRLGYDAPTTAPATLIVKLASPHERVRRAAASGYAKEVAFYRELGADPGVSVPRCYGGALDATTGEVVLALEELAEPPGKWSRLELARRTIDEIAPFHARWWRSPRLASMAWLHHGEADRLIARLFAAAAPALEPRLGAAVPKTFASVAVLFAQRYEALAAWVMEGPLTLVHGDLHLQQVYWAASGRFAILDWQTVRAAPGASDVSRLIASSTEPETQAAEECALVERYHAALVANGVEGYSLDACWEHYRRSLLQSVLIHTVGAAQLDLTQFQGRSAAQGRAWTDRFFGWVDAALVRHGVLEWMRSVQ